MVYYRFLKGNNFQAIADLVMVFILFFAYYVLTLNKKYFKAAARFVTLSALTITTLLLFTVEDIIPLISWYGSIMYILFFFLNAKEAWMWMRWVIGILTISHVLGLAKHPINDVHFIIFISNLIFVSIVLSWYEKIKSENEEYNLQYQNKLEAEIEYHTKALAESNAVLAKLNATLEERVNEEIAKNRKQEHHMLQQSRMAQMGEMLSMIAHQWRQPLSAISSSTASLQLKILLGKYNEDKFKEKIELISDYAQHLSQTIDDFRNFFKTNKEKDKTNFEEIVHDTLLIMNHSLEKKRILLILDFEESVDFMSFRNELKQVLLNLIKNAEDALLEKSITNPQITIKTTQNDSSIILEISDNAGGIENDIIENIFDPYFTTKAKRDGTGLGLYMSKTIVEEHCEGILEIFNQEEGACFRIVLNR